MTRERWMALSFAIGAVCFLVAPSGAYARLVGNDGDLATYLVGSIPFTVGGALQSWLAFPEREHRRTGRVLWRAAVIQSAGTLCFNFMTLRALDVGPAAASYNLAVWAPNALGSVCFLLSGLLVYSSSSLRRGLPVPGGPGWYEAALNLLGCVLFGISAAAGYVAAGATAPLSPAISNWGTSLGALCFLTCAVGTLVSGHTVKSARLRRLEHELVLDVERDLEHDLERLRRW